MSPLPDTPVASLDGPVDAVYRHGYQSWSATGWVAPDHPFPRAVREVDRRAADHPDIDRSAHESSDVSVLVGPDRDAVLLGALGHGGRVAADVHSSTLSGTGPAGLDWFRASGSELEVLDRYATALGEVVGVRRSTPRAPRVWCSWYAFYTQIDPDVIAEVVDDLGDLPFDVVQLDDGWQREIGDWRCNDAFGDLGRTADLLQRRGRRAGLWLAPFLVHERAAAARTDQGLFVRGDDGDPLVAADNWGGDSYALDVTRPEVVERLCAMAREAVDAGFGYLKLDFLYAAALPGRRHDDVDPLDAYRDAMVALRDEVGDDVYLLGCGAPVVASLGVVDGLRIGPDVAEVWDVPPATVQLAHLGQPTARYAIATSSARTWLAPLVDLDPDVVFVRSRRNQLGHVTRGLLADLARICGFVATSDPVGWLDGRERDALRRLLEEEPEVEQVGRHQWSVDGRLVDLAVAAAAPPGVAVPGPDPLPARLPEVHP